MRLPAVCSALLAGLLSVGAQAFQPTLDALATVPQQRLPAGLVADNTAASRSNPLAFATGVKLQLGEQDGLWDEPAPALARWRLRLSSPGALNLSLLLETLQLPDGAQLWFYSADGRDLQGPYTQAGLLPIVRDDEAVLEARMPAAARDTFRLRIAEAYHGYRPLAGAGPQAKGALGDSDGNCHIDVACADGNGWRNEIRSTVIYTRRGLLGAVLTLCSGTLVNNTVQDDRALILTANHCGITSGTTMSDVQVYFNVQKSSCNGTADGPVNQVIPGGRFLARDSESDFTLFELASRPPSSFGAHYAGWDARSDAVASSGVGIHHPGGDDKKISSYSSALRRVDNAQIETFTVDAWEVRWARGVTEQGSSGSGLWNQNRRLVGVLSGGGSSCSSPDAPDLYGRLERGWTANTASTGQLKAHLDPASTGALLLDGKNAGGAPGSVGNGGGSSGGGGGGGGAFGWGLLAVLLGIAGLRTRRR